MYRLALSLVLILLPALPLQAQDLSARLVTDLSIGDDESAPLEYLFAGPQHIATDSEGRIYVADRDETTHLYLETRKGGFPVIHRDRLEINR